MVERIVKNPHSLPPVYYIFHQFVKINLEQIIFLLYFASQMLKEVQHDEHLKLLPA